MPNAAVWATPRMAVAGHIQKPLAEPAPILIPGLLSEGGGGLGQQRGFFDVDERLQELSAKGDALERLSELVDFELFRADLERAVPRSDGSKGGRPAFDHVLMLKVLLLQAMHTLSDERCEYLIKD